MMLKTLGSVMVVGIFTLLIASAIIGFALKSNGAGGCTPSLAATGHCQMATPIRGAQQP
jgi:hypothetical protein